MRFYSPCTDDGLCISVRLYAHVPFDSLHYFHINSNLHEQMYLQICSNCFSDMHFSVDLIFRKPNKYDN